MPDESTVADRPPSTSEIAVGTGTQPKQEKDSLVEASKKAVNEGSPAESAQSGQPQQTGVYAPQIYQAAHAPEPYQWPAGLYCQDGAGNTQGPYTREAMQSFNQQWPLLFPPSMMLWYTDGAQSSQMVPLAWCLAGSVWQPDARAAAEGMTAPAAEGSTAVAAPSSYSAYAEAVLAGLPEDDETVQLARAAQAAGSSLQDLVAFQHQARPGHAAGTGDRSAEGASKPASAVEEVAALYDDMKNYCSPEEFARFVEQQAKRKAAGQPPRDWRKLKKRKEELRSKLRDSSMAWLRD